MLKLVEVRFLFIISALTRLWWHERIVFNCHRLQNSN